MEGNSNYFRDSSDTLACSCHTHTRVFVTILTMHVRSPPSHEVANSPVLIAAHNPACCVTTLNHTVYERREFSHTERQRKASVF